jgi:hypothetical protein
MRRGPAYAIPGHEEHAACLADSDFQAFRKKLGAGLDSGPSGATWADVSATLACYKI